MNQIDEIYSSLTESVIEFVQECEIETLIEIAKLCFGEENSDVQRLRHLLGIQ